VQILGLKKPQTKKEHLVLIFGVGMIGSYIINALRDFQYASIAGVEIDWQDSDKRSSCLGEILDLVENRRLVTEKVSIVWSAGKCNFHSSENEANRELLAFQEIVDFALKLKGQDKSASLDFHLVSSAGGLFEGQRLVIDTSIPFPLRPYGNLKLAQENSVRHSFKKGSFVIYRPSSVYGPMVQKSQQGLINNLIRNAQNRLVTILDSHVMALRDYVFAGDIGKYVAKRICFPVTMQNQSPIDFLVSSRCASIYEVVHKVQRILNIKLKYRLDQSFGNSSHITFSDRVLPVGWSPSTLDVGLRQFLMSNNT
jgi:nucleoside-diphosphate-sugar epimerase